MKTFLTVIIWAILFSVEGNDVDIYPRGLTKTLAYI